VNYNINRGGRNYLEANVLNGENDQNSRVVDIVVRMGK
jgi:hypothetical protein